MFDKRMQNRVDAYHPQKANFRSHSDEFREAADVHSRLVGSADGHGLIRRIVGVHAVARGHGIAAIRQPFKGELAGTVRCDGAVAVPVNVTVAPEPLSVKVCAEVKFAVALAPLIVTARFAGVIAKPDFSGLP
jgi:hypothetical protein